MTIETHRSATGRTSPKPARPGRKPANPAKASVHEEEVARVASAVVAARHAAHHADIAREAYYRAERRGFQPGYELDDWLAAEKTLNGETAHPAVDDPAGTYTARYQPVNEI